MERSNTLTRCLAVAALSTAALCAGCRDLTPRISANGHILAARPSPTVSSADVAAGRLVARSEYLTGLETELARVQRLHLRHPSEEPHDSPAEVRSTVAGRGPSGRPSGVIADRLPSRCSHPYVPSEPGEVRAYRISVPSRAMTGHATLHAVERRDDGANAVTTWELQMDVAGVPDSSVRSDMRCIAAPDGPSAEEPWFGVGLPITSLTGRWTWPARLEPGTTFGGSLRVSTDSAPVVTRAFTVGDIVIQTVPAGSFRTVHVTYVDEVTGEDGMIQEGGQLWVAEVVGLVRSVTTSMGVETTWELERIERPDVGAP